MPYTVKEMTKKTIASLLAFSTVFLSAALAISVPTEHVFASASSLEDRVAARRVQRLGAPVEQRTIQKRSTRSTSVDRRRERLNARRLRQVELPKVEINTSLSSLKRRELRRTRRLSGKPVPVKQQIADGVNMERAKHGLAPLRYHTDLATSAQEHAQDMGYRDFFSHENPEGQRSGDRIKETGYGVVNAQECRCSYKVYLGENIAKGQNTVDQVIEEWMASPSHREAMLSKDYQEIGVGIAGDIWVLNLGHVDITPVR